MVNGEQVEDVEEFVYLGAIADREGGCRTDIKNRVHKAPWCGQSQESGEELRCACSLRHKFDCSCYMAVKHGRPQRSTKES